VIVLSFFGCWIYHVYGYYIINKLSRSTLKTSSVSTGQWVETCRAVLPQWVLAASIA
jgi:hypothetical protein